MPRPMLERAASEGLLRADAVVGLLAGGLDG